MFLVSSYLLALFSNVYGFNIDTKYAIVKELASGDAYFGYSVAQHSTGSLPDATFDQ